LKKIPSKNKDAQPLKVMVEKDYDRHMKITVQVCEIIEYGDHNWLYPPEPKACHTMVGGYWSPKWVRRWQYAHTATTRWLRSCELSEIHESKPCDKVATHAQHENMVPANLRAPATY
jgi:hypothetical protein